MSQLPGEPGQDQEGAQTALPPMGDTPPLPLPAPGLPRGLFDPTRQPSVPASAPMTPMDGEMESTPPNQVVQVLRLLAENRTQTVSRTTQRWALGLLDAMGQ
jgi:hypothetical protein